MRFKETERTRLATGSFMYPNGRGLVIFSGEVYCKQGVPDDCKLELLEKDSNECLRITLPDGGVIDFLPRCTSMNLQSKWVMADLPKYTQYYFPTMRLTIHIYSCFKK